MVHHDVSGVKGGSATDIYYLYGAISHFYITGMVMLVETSKNQYAQHVCD